MHGPCSARRLTVAELIHVVIEYGLFQRALVVGRNSVRVAVRAELARPGPGERPRGRRVKQGRLVIQSRSTSFRYIQSQSSVRSWRRPFPSNL